LASAGIRAASAGAQGRLKTLRASLQLALSKCDLVSIEVKRVREELYDARSVLTALCGLLAVLL
jgi:hypothetical protein